MADKQPNLINTGVPLYRKFTSSGKFVCFSCRVCFHKAHHCNPVNHANAGPCNNCGKPLHYAGSAFRAPPKRDVKEWAKLELLIRDGMRFHYCGGNGKLPDTVNEARKVRSARKRKARYARMTAAGKRVALKTTNAYYTNGSYQLPD